MATLYILVAVGSSVAGIGMVGFLTPALANPVWFTNDHWKQFADAVPAWWSPRDHEAVQSYYLGNSTLYTAGHLRAWLPPILVWGGFLLLIMLMTMCFAAILRRQWVEHERLTFPITYLPVAMTVQEGGFAAFICYRTLWAGFAIPVVLQTINSLNYLFPSLPAIPVKPVEKGPLDLGTLFSSAPWNAIGSLPLAFHPNTIGLSYLLSTDVSFSCWFFHLLRKFLEVFCVAMGWRTGAGATAGARMPYTSEQGVGAWLCLALLVIWMARTHLRAVIQGALHPDQADDAREGMSYRTAVCGALLTFLGAVGFAWWGGLPLVASFLLLGFFAAYMLALMRIRAETGTAWHFGPDIRAPEMVSRTLGPMHLNVAALSVLAYHTWYNFDYRAITSPHFIEGYAIADQGRLAARRLTGAMLLALLVGIVCSSWTMLHLYYVYGAGTAHVNNWRINMMKIPYWSANGHLNERHTGPDVAGMSGIAAGVAVTLLLNAARLRFTGWPFHPAGYAIANTDITNLLWFPFFVGWLAKSLTLRYGGMKAYRAALPFFIGLILGDYVIASLWTFVGIVLGIDMYRCFPN